MWFLRRRDTGRLERRRTVLLAVVCGLLIVVGGCSVPGFGPDADEAADRLASGLAAGDLGKVDFTDSASQVGTSYARVTEGVGKAKVSVTKVSTDGDTARATLTWRRPVGAKTWSYQTQATLRRGEDTHGDRAWLVDWDPRIVESSLKAGERMSESSIKPRRGEIVGADDAPIVVPRPVLRVGIDKTGLAAAVTARSAARLAQLVDLVAGPYAKQVGAAGPQAFVQAIVYRRGSVPGDVLDGVEAIPGARAIADKLPLAPDKDFAAAILGTVGPATAELVKQSKGRIRPGDDVGLSGLQKRYDAQLSGTRGATVVAVDEGGTRRTLFTADAKPGKPLSTTIEIQAQRAAQKALSGVGPASALVAIRPSTGDVVAAASGPGSKGYNTATFGQYAPGSTFKVVSALALLRAGVSPTTEVPCTPTVVVDGKTFKNYDDYPAAALGRISFADALANSCNTAFISQRDQLTAGSLAAAAAALGLGVDHDTGFPAFFGTVKPADSETQKAAGMIGQGTVLASPMAMATVVASVLEGSAVLPRLLTDRKVEHEAPAKPLTAAEARQLRTMMRGVVERGSGRLLADLPGGPVIAKTGTAEFGDKPPLPTHAWMVAGRGDLAVAVFVERGDSGSGTAGPVIKDFLATVR
jgi:cell division protein FtsI/penicillin-binding protein 2